MKKIIISFLAILLLFTNNLYAYNIKFKANTTDPRGEETLRIILMSGAYQGTIDEYEAIKGKNNFGRWIDVSTEPNEIEGGELSYRTHAFIFHDDTINTDYIPGFNASGYDDPYNLRDVYYDIYNNGNIVDFKVDFNKKFYLSRVK